MVICYFGSGLQERDWLHRYRFTWLHGCMVAQLHGSTVAWLHGYMVAWLHGYMVARLHGCTVTWLTLLHGAADWKTGARFERKFWRFCRVPPIQKYFWSNLVEFGRIYPEQASGNRGGISRVSKTFLTQR